MRNNERTSRRGRTKKGEEEEEERGGGGGRGGGAGGREEEEDGEEGKIEEICDSKLYSIFNIGNYNTFALFSSGLFADPDSSSITKEFGMMLLGAFGLVCVIVIITIAALAIYIKNRGTYLQLV